MKGGHVVRRVRVQFWWRSDGNERRGKGRVDGASNRPGCQGRAGGPADRHHIERQNGRAAVVGEGSSAHHGVCRGRKGWKAADVASWSLASVWREADVCRRKEGRRGELRPSSQAGSSQGEGVGDGGGG